MLLNHYTTFQCCHKAHNNLVKRIWPIWAFWEFPVACEMQANLGFIRNLFAQIVNRSLLRLYHSLVLWHYTIKLTDRLCKFQEIRHYVHIAYLCCRCTAIDLTALTKCSNTCCQCNVSLNILHWFCASILPTLCPALSIYGNIWLLVWVQYAGEIFPVFLLKSLQQKQSMVFLLIE